MDLGKGFVIPLAAKEVVMSHFVRTFVPLSFVAVLMCFCKGMFFLLSVQYGVGLFNELFS